MVIAVNQTTSPLAHFSFPRTGKRGVPQQFPRRLFEMLDSETKSAEADARYPKIISWSDSGKAFRIFDVAEFSSTVLPKYFRTKKFSSFQRNLNLVRIGIPMRSESERFSGNSSHFLPYGLRYFSMGLPKNDTELTLICTLIIRL
jgi:HSF-type DNA-binding